jgi:LacI family transcriptional regulator
MLLGISKFVGEINRWDVHHNAGSWSLHGDNSGPSHIEPLDSKMPVDGVITRIYDTHSLSRAKALVEKGIPVVDILGDHSDSSIPLVHTDDAGIAQLALKHLREQGFTNFGFCGIENTRWSDLREITLRTPLQNLVVKHPPSTSPNYIFQRATFIKI